MAAKLTPMVQENKAKKAIPDTKQTGKSISVSVRKYSGTLMEEQPDNNALSSKLKKIAGAVKLPVDFDEKKELQKYLAKKHL